MKILITGSSGLIGTALTRALRDEGNDLLRLVRSPTPAAPTDIPWDPASQDRVSDDRLEGLDAVIHLAGEPILGRWTSGKKARIRTSRVRDTDVLSQSLANVTAKPRTLLCASAMGYYGDTEADAVNEESPAGEGYLPSVCRDWEAASAVAGEAKIRVVHMRFGLVLSQDGGALQKMLPAFRLGLGGPVGSGRQYMSWISMRDTVAAILHLLHNEAISGPVNLVSPNPESNAAFTRALGRVLSRPAKIPIPAFAVRILMGEAADATVLASIRVQPRVLLDSGFTFQDVDLEPALRALLQRDRA